VILSLMQHPCSIMKHIDLSFIDAILAHFYLKTHLA